MTQVAQETELTTDYKRIFEYKKRTVKADKQIIGAIALSF